MSGMRRLFSLDRTFAFVALLLGLFGCSASQPPTRPAAARASAVNPAPPSTRFTAPNVTPATAQLMLGIDVLESQGFAPVKGKRLGLLTHPAGVNRNGISTIDVLLRSRQSKLVALFGPEHGIYGNEKAEIKIPNRTDPRTGLPVYSLYGQTRKPTPAMLKGLDAFVIDLQDVGTRSYTYVSAMKLAMEACFENNVEVIVLDRPNPLGGIKVSGPLLDAKWTSYVGAFRVPYVHGLTIAELARLAKELPGVLAISETARANGRLTVIPMRGWRRTMRWPETGLQWVPTSPMIQDFSAVIGYAMVGLGTYADPRVGFDIGFRHGVGEHYAFRGISHKTVKSDVLERELRALNIPGIGFRRVSVPGRDGKPATGVFVEVNDWDDWDPTEFSFHLMVLGCRLGGGKNPFAVTDTSASGFLRHMGSEDFFRTLQRNGAQTNLSAWLDDWQRRGQVYRKASQRYWLYQ